MQTSHFEVPFAAFSARIAKYIFLLLLIPNSAFAEPSSFTGKVVGISDGDTIIVMHEGRGEKVRLFGIDCPEKNQDFGQRAKKEASELVFTKEVTILTQGSDRYGRTLGIVELPNGKTLNHLLVENGMCWWYQRYAPLDTEAEKLEARARREKRGLWAMPNPIPPWEFRKVAKEKDVRRGAVTDKSREFDN